MLVGVANNSVMTVMDSLLSLDRKATAAVTPTGVGSLFLTNQSMRSHATSLLGAINDTGGI